MIASVPSKLPLERLKEGMTLSQDVSDRSGRLIAKAGERLDARIMVRLKAGGVAFVEVAEEAAPAKGAAGESDLEKRIETVLARKFQGTEGNVLMDEIRQLAKTHLVARRRVPS